MGGVRRRARPPRRHQEHLCDPDRPRRPAADVPRGPGRRSHRPPERRRRPRPADGGRPAQPGHGVRRGGHPRRPHQAVRAHRAPAGRRARIGGGGCSRRGAPAGDRPPRHQARQHPHHAAWRAQAGRLRYRPGRRRRQHDGHRVDGRDAGVHGARDRPRRSGRRPLGHLVARRHPVRRARGLRHPSCWIPHEEPMVVLGRVLHAPIRRPSCGGDRVAEVVTARCSTAIPTRRPNAHMVAELLRDPPTSLSGAGHHAVAGAGCRHGHRSGRPVLPARRCGRRRPAPTCEPRNPSCRACGRRATVRATDPASDPPVGRAGRRSQSWRSSCCCSPPAPSDISSYRSRNRTHAGRGPQLRSGTGDIRLVVTPPRAPHDSADLTDHRPPRRASSSPDVVVRRPRPPVNGSTYGPVRAVSRSRCSARGWTRDARRRQQRT